MAGLFRADVAVMVLSVVFTGHVASAQRAKRSAQTASEVGAELVMGKLNPSSSKAGDEVALRLKDDMKSNGQVVLKKGSTIKGVVRDVQSAAAADVKQPQSMMTIEWFVPAQAAKAPKQIMVAVRSLSYVNPVEAGGSTTVGASSMTGTQASAFSNGRVAGAPLKANAAVLSMPSVVAVDTQTSRALQTAFGLPKDPLFKTGRGEIVSPGGSKHNLDIFSHFSNDTVLVSPSADFEIASGAQIQLLVGVQK